MSNAITRLVRRQWGNELYTAGPVFLECMVDMVAQLPADQMCVECGSGLSSVLLCDLLPKERLVVLEHDEHWFKEIIHEVNGSLKYAPLEEKGEYDWYRLPDLSGRKVGLVVCDGPPGGTRGGRYGALPELMPHLADEYAVLLDDVQRKPEHDIAMRWTEEYDLVGRFFRDDDGKAFAMLTNKEK